MIIILLLLLLPFPVLGDSTETVLMIPTTYQLLITDIDKLSKEDRIAEIDIELLKNPDEITGQNLTNYKTYLTVELKHESQGRNYFGYINYPVYREK